MLTAEEEALLKPVAKEEAWRRKQREVITAAKAKCKERDDIRSSFNA